jgi:hypothetical protein
VPLEQVDDVDRVAAGIPIVERGIGDDGVQARHHGEQRDRQARRDEDVIDCLARPR